MDQFDTKELGGLGKYFFKPYSSSEAENTNTNEITNIISFQEVYVEREIPSRIITEAGDRKIVSFNKNAFSYKNSNREVVKNIKRIARTMTEYGCATDSIRKGNISSQDGTKLSIQERLANVISNPILLAKQKETATSANSDKKRRKRAV